MTKQARLDRTINTACAYLKAGNSYAYAASMSAEWRAGNRATQRTILDEIHAHGTENLFNWDMRDGKLFSLTAADQG